MDIKIEKAPKSISKVISLCSYSLLLALFIYFVLRQSYLIIAYNTPKELREMNTVAFAHYFAHMGNPYSVSALKQDIPIATSIYGLLVPLLMSPFLSMLSFTHLSSLQICELLTLIVEVIGTLSFYRLLFRKTKTHLLSMIGALLFHTCYWRYSFFGGAFPDQWGLTLSIILMDFLNVDEQKKHYRPLLYAGCIVSLFYIKQYFVLLVIGLCIYLFIYSVKDLKKFIIYGILLGCLSVVLVYFLFPLYFSEVFPIAHGQTIIGDRSYSLIQVAELSLCYAPVTLFTIIGILVSVYRICKHKRIRNAITYEVCQIISIFPPLFHIAENQGTNYTYYLQLWYPYIILYGIIFVSAALAYLHQTYQKQLCIYLLAVLSLTQVLPFYRFAPMTKEQQEAWNHAYDILEQYSDGEILVSMLLSNYCLEHGIATSNYGQAEYNNIKNLENYKDNKLWRNIFLFDYTEELLQQNISYNQRVKDKIYTQSYDCIVLVYAAEYHLSDDDIINAGYHIIASEDLISGTQCWHTVFYILNEQTAR